MPSTSHGLSNLNSSTPVLLTTITTIVNQFTKNNNYNWNTIDLVIQNVDSSATVYIGGSNVTSASYGYKLVAGATLQLNGLLPSTPLYAISSGTSSLAVLGILK